SDSRQDRLANGLDLFLQGMIEIAQKRDHCRVGLRVALFRLHNSLSGAGARGIGSLSILSDSALYQLSPERGRQRVVGRKSNRAVAGVVLLEFVFVSGHRGRAHRVESAMVGSRAEGDQRTSVEAKRRESVADTLLRLRHCPLDGPAQFLEGSSLVVANRG